jgi:capsular exopolysaccharide synthesis family protein
MNALAPAAAPATWTANFVRGPIDLRRVWATLRRYRILFSAVFLVVVGLAALYAFTKTPVYTASTSVMIDTRHQTVSESKQVLSDLPTDTAAVDTEVEVMKSRTLVGRVVDELKLVNDPEFNAALRTGGFSLFPRKAPPNTAAEKARERDATIDAVAGAMQADRRGLTYVINISFTSVSPAKAALIANALSERYLTSQLDAKLEATQRANNWLQQQLGSMRQQVTSAEQAVASYQSNKGLLVATGSQLTEQQVAQLQSNESVASADLAEKQAKLNTARAQLAKGGNGEDLGEALGSAVIGGLRAKLSDAIRNQQQLTARYGPRHPDVIASQNAQHQLEQDIQSEVHRIVGSLEADVNASQQRLNSIRADLSRARGQLATNKGAEVGMNDLQRNADAQSTVYKSLLSRFQETSTQTGSLQSDAQLVSPAQVPLSPSAPKIKVVMAVATVLGLLLASAAVAAMEMWTGEIRTSEDVERMLGAPAIGSIPTTKGSTKLDPTRYLVENPVSAFAESFRNIRSGLRRADLDRPVSVLAVTSALPNEGKSTTSLCLARSIAQGGHRTIVVDCDLRRRTLHSLVGVKPSVGLLEVLSGQNQLQEAVIHDETTGCDLLPLSGSRFTPRDVFSTQSFTRLIAYLREHYDFVVLDCPPVLAVADTRAIALHTDGVLFLVQWQKTPARAVKHALDSIEAVGGRTLGVALTKVNLKAQAAYGYGDSGFYYRSYASYYAQA